MKRIPLAAFPFPLRSLSEPPTLESALLRVRNNSQEVQFIRGSVETDPSSSGLSPFGHCLLLAVSEAQGATIYTGSPALSA